MVYVNVVLTVREEADIPLVIRLLADQGRLSRQEPGCISHGFAEDVMAPGTFVFVERWRDMAAVQEHFAKEYSREVVVTMRRLATESTGVEIHEVASTRVV